MTRVLIRVGVVVVAAGLVAACVGGGASGDGANDGSSGSSSGGSDATTTDAKSDGASSSSSGAVDAAIDQQTLPRTPKKHRPAPVECTHVRGPGDGDPLAQNAPCTTDAECTAGENGRCLRTKVAAQLNYCSYDGCFADTACAGKVCTCREAASDANRCSGGNCKVDADCGANGFCSPTVDFDKTNFGVTGYYCHTASDTCVDDEDCIDGGTQTQAKCAYDPTTSATGNWACSSNLFLPP